MYDILLEESKFICDYNSSVYIDYFINCKIIVIYLLCYSFLFFFYFLILSLFLCSIWYFICLLRGDPYGKVEI